MALGSAAFAGWALWQTSTTRAEHQELQSDWQAWQSNAERTQSRFQTEQQALVADEFGQLQVAMTKGDEGSADALREPLAGLRTQVDELQMLIGSESDRREEQLQALAGRLDGAYGELQALADALARAEGELVGRGDAWQQERSALLERLETVEAFALPREAPPTGVQAAAWFPITEDLVHAQAAIRLDAVYSLEQSHDVRICEFLLPLLKDPDSLVRVATGRILSEHKYRPAVAQLIAGLEDPVLSVRDGFAKALRHITSKQFGFRADARETERKRPVAQWRDWWKGQGSEFLQGASQ